MPIFIIFEPRLLPQLDEKRCKGEKCKTAIKLSREVKQTVLIVEEVRYPVLQLSEKNHIFAIVEGGKVDFFSKKMIVWPKLKK